MKKAGIIMCMAAIAAGISVSAADIDATVTLRKIHVSVKNTEQVKKPTIQLLNGDKTRVLYTGEGSFDGTEYIFDDFSIGASEETGSYCIRIGENGKITETQIYYASYSELMAMLEGFCSEDCNTAELIETYAEVLQIDKEVYKALSDNWKKRIDSEIKKLELAYSEEEQVIKSHELLKNTIAEYINYAQLCTTSQAETVISAAAAIDGLDLTWWNSITDKAWISSVFAGYEINELTLTKKELSDMFDGAVLTGVIAQNDWGSGRQALGYYVNKGLLTVSNTYLNAGADTYKALKNKQIKNYKDIPPELAKLYVPPTQNGGGGSGSGGGGSNSSGKTVSVSEVYAPTNTATENQGVSFTDIGSVSWANIAITELSKAGVLQGKGNGIFAPNDSLTRAEFVKIMVSALELTDENAKVSFEDVPQDEWYYKYIASAKKAGLAAGISESLFGVNDSITREDMAVMVLRLMKLFDIDTTGTAADFSDYNEISDYAKDAVLQLSGAGIINGMGDGTFSPKTYVTRAQGAKVIYDLLIRKG